MRNVAIASIGAALFTVAVSASAQAAPVAAHTLSAPNPTITQVQYRRSGMNAFAASPGMIPPEAGGGGGASFSAGNGFGGEDTANNGLAAYRGVQSQPYSANGGSGNGGGGGGGR